MRLEWIDDILAVLDGGSLVRAAEKRLLTQSAFTRRVRLIEESVGVTMFDRRRKPVSLLPEIQALEPEMRDLSARLHKLRETMRISSDRAAASMGIICQHALTTTVAPQVVYTLDKDFQIATRVRSGNQDECLLHLISKDVDFAIMYAVPQDEIPEPGSAFEAATIGTDVLVPVASPDVRDKARTSLVPTITYPADIFLGQVYAQRIGPRMPMGLKVSVVAETALTLAMLQLALKGIGVAWLPLSLVRDHLTQGQLIQLDDILPSQPLSIRILRLNEAQSDLAERVWQELTQRIPLQLSGT